MARWFLKIETPTTTHTVQVGVSDDDAQAVLEYVRTKMGSQEAVKIADQIVLPAATIVSAWLEKRP